MKVVITEVALTNLEEALDLLKENFSEKSRLMLAAKVISSTYKLAVYPEMGQIEPVLESLNLGHRRIIEGHFKIVYRINASEETIYVTDIFDSRQDPKKVKH
ncbi:MAG: toxin ParE1/3/4 [Granulosicoccus sp.]